MSQDVYTSWLGIPPGPRPVDHYTLLGVARFSQDTEAIEQAVRRRMDTLDRFAIHPDRAKRQAIQNLMNELAIARVTLVRPEQKLQYDQSLAAALGVAAPRATAPAERGEKGLKPRDAFIARLRRHLNTWVLDAHEERLLVAEAAAVGIAESEAVRIIRAINAEADTLAGKSRRKMAIGIAVIIIGGAGAIYAFVLRPAMQRSQVNAAFDQHMTAAKTCFDQGRHAQAMAEIDQALSLKSQEAAPRAMRVRVQYAMLLNEAALAVKKSQYVEAAQKLEAAEKLQPQVPDAAALREQTLEALSRQIESALAAGNLAQAQRLLTGVQALGAGGARAAKLGESIRALHRKNALDEASKALAAGNYAAARARLDEHKALGGGAAAGEMLVRQHGDKLLQTFRSQWQAKQWAAAAQTAAALRQFKGDGGEWNIPMLLGMTAAPQGAQAVALAAEWVQIAAHSSLTPWPQFKLALAKTAYEWACATEGGEGPAAQAVDLIATLQGPTAESVVDMRLKLLEERMKRADTQALKRQVGDQMIDLLTGLCERHIVAADYARAESCARRACDIATATFSPRADATAALLKAVTEPYVSELRKLHAAPDAAAARRLFQIYFVELNLPAPAMGVVGKMNAPKAAEMLRLASLDVKYLSSAQCGDVGRWLAELAGQTGVSVGAATRLKTQSQQYLSRATAATAAAMPDVLLSKVPWVSAKSTSKYPPQYDVVCEQYPHKKTTLCIRKTRYATGLSAGAPCEIVYDIDPSWQVLVVEVGLDNVVLTRAPKEAGPIQAEILIDGKVIYQSPVLGIESQPCLIVQPIPPGSKRLHLTAKPASEKKRCYVTWGRAGFIAAGKIPHAPAPAVAPPAPPAAQSGQPIR